MLSLTRTVASVAKHALRRTATPITLRLALVYPPAAAPSHTRFSLTCLRSAHTRTPAMALSAFPSELRWDLSPEDIKSHTTQLIADATAVFDSIAAQTGSSTVTFETVIAPLMALDRDLEVGSFGWIELTAACGDQSMGLSFKPLATRC